MNRQQRRQLERQLAKIEPRLLEEFERRTFTNGVAAGISAMEKALREEFGFGDKRLKRLAAAIERDLEKETKTI